LGALKTGDTLIGRLRPWRPAATAFAVYFLIATVYTWPLLWHAGDQIASDAGDPILNASILWWNATVGPFTPAWWSPPFFFPSQNVAAFTENLVGLGPVATPIFWATGQPILTYNLTYFLTWPLGAIAAYWLAWTVLRRRDAAFLAGLVFAFAPYRLGQIPHIQVLTLFWLPMALVGLHRYVMDGRRRWLALFGAAWLLQSLANGYFMFFGGVLIALWIAYFCSTRSTWRAAGPILLAWLVTSLPLAMVMLRYRAIHQHYGLARPANAAFEFGAQPWAWWSPPPLVWFWSGLGVRRGELELFPGLIGPLLVVAAVAAAVARRTPSDVTVHWQRWTRRLLGAIAMLSVAAIAFTLYYGRWRLQFGGLEVRMSGIGRAAIIAMVSGAAFVWLKPSIRERLRRRSVFAFYAAATLIVMILASGPTIRHGSHVLLESAPYGWLMAIVPGLDGLRVTARFWMVGTLCLGVAAAAAFAWLVPRKGAVSVLVCVLSAGGVLLDSWPRRFPMARPPVLWPAVEPADGAPHATIELPLGPAWDAAATFRSMSHRHPVVNGVSGYDPPHYGLVRSGLEARDPSVLVALASFGPLDVIVDRSQDRDGSLDRYAAAIPGMVRLGEDGPLVRYGLPETPTPVLGSPISVASTHTTADWVVADLGTLQPIAAVELSFGASGPGFPARTSVQLSSDGESWTTAWEGSAVGTVVRGIALDPANIRTTFAFSGVPARFIRVSVTTDIAPEWRAFGPRAAPAR
jgi:hypothetical protein